MKGSMVLPGFFCLSAALVFFSYLWDGASDPLFDSNKKKLAMEFMVNTCTNVQVAASLQRRFMKVSLVHHLFLLIALS